MAAPVTIWVSACLLGNPVRYDGGHKQQAGLAEWLAGWARVIPLCPEVFAGLGTPRPPVQRQQGPDGERLVLADTGTPTAVQLPAACARLIAESEQPTGAILKARSPSCGAGTSPLYDLNNEILTVGDGVFVQAIRAIYPHLPIADEATLADAALRDAFVRQVMRSAEKS